MTPQDQVNLVLLAYKVVNRCIIADGVVGKEAVRAIQSRRHSTSLSADDLNRIILALKATGHNNALIADGEAGQELWKAEEDFLAVYAKI